MTRASKWIPFLMIVATSGRAAAQVPGAPEEVHLGDRGHLTISAERLFGFDYTSVSRSMNGMEIGSNQATTFSLLGNPAAGIYTPASFPRVALDGFVTRGLSIGASLGVFHYSLSSGSSDNSITGLQVTPRIGYLARIAPKLSIWPRIGVTYQHVSSDSTSQGVPGSSSSFDALIGTVEAPFVFSVVPRAAITFGPTFDYSFTGQSTSSGSVGISSTTDQKLREVGVQFGLLVLL